MPMVHVQTSIPKEEYMKLKEKAERLMISEYELLQDAIMVFLNEPEKTEVKQAIQRLLEFVKKDLGATLET